MSRKKYNSAQKPNNKLHEKNQASKNQNKNFKFWGDVSFNDWDINTNNINYIQKPIEAFFNTKKDLNKPNKENFNNKEVKSLEAKDDYFGLNLLDDSNFSNKSKQKCCNNNSNHDDIAYYIE